MQETVIELLLMNQMDVNAVNLEGETPLHLAIILNALKSAHVLLQHHANPNISTPSGNIPLHYIAPGCSEDDQ